MPAAELVVRTGRLVVATPTLTEASFHRTVVLLLQAAPEGGAVGVVINRPSGTGVDEVLPEWAAHATAPGVVFTGGPVQPTSAVCLGRGRQAGPAYAPLDGLPRVGTVDLDQPPSGVEGVRLFAGYAGWSPGQLEAEVAEGSWWVLDALPGDPFDPEPAALWARVLRRQGPPLAFAAGYPADPTLN